MGFVDRFKRRAQYKMESAIDRQVDKRVFNPVESAIDGALDKATDSVAGIFNRRKSAPQEMSTVKTAPQEFTTQSARQNTSRPMMSQADMQSMNPEQMRAQMQMMQEQMQMMQKQMQGLTDKQAGPGNVADWMNMLSQQDDTGFGAQK